MMSMSLCRWSEIAKSEGADDIVLDLNLGAKPLRGRIGMAHHFASTQRQEAFSAAGLPYHAKRGQRGGRRNASDKGHVRNAEIRVADYLWGPRCRAVIPSYDAED